MATCNMFAHGVPIIWNTRAVLLIALVTTGIYLSPAEAESPTYSIWGASRDVAEDDNQPVEVGMKFSSALDGEVSAVRFYRAVANHGGYIARIWSADGELLGVGAAFEGQQPTPGWQTVQVYPPVPIVAGRTYIASYYSSNGQYSVSQDYFANGSIVSGPLQALGNGIDGGNGVYVYGLGGGFPTETYKASNYWVDVVFTPKAVQPSVDPQPADPGEL